MNVLCMHWGLPQTHPMNRPYCQLHSASHKLRGALVRVYVEIDPNEGIFQGDIQI